MEQPRNQEMPYFSRLYHCRSIECIYRLVEGLFLSHSMTSNRTIQTSYILSTMRYQPPNWEQKPFVQVEGVFNVRQFGGYPSILFPNARTRENFLYRSGHLEDITMKGQRTLEEDLRIAAIFDLRSEDESAVCTELGFYDGTPISRSIAGCERIRLPIQRESYSFKQRVDRYVKSNINPEESTPYLRVYTE